MNLENKKILVTGGNGYLGSFLVKALKKENAEVFIIDRNTNFLGEGILVDITNEEDVNNAVQKIQPDIIFHLAATLNRERNFNNFETIDKINHLGTFYLLNALKNVDYENFIFISSSEIYGDNKAPFHENQIPDPASPYSLTKVYSENLINTFSKIYNKKFTILRLFNFFGKDMPKQFFIPQMIDALKTKESFEMTEGEQNRDFLYIDDVVNGMILSAKNKEYKNEIYNLCSGKAVSLKELVTTIKEQLKSNCKINFGALPYRENEVWNMLGDNSKIKKQLGFEVKYNLGKAIKEII